MSKVPENQKRKEKPFTIIIDPLTKCNVFTSFMMKFLSSVVITVHLTGNKNLALPKLVYGFPSDSSVFNNEAASLLNVPWSPPFFIVP